MSKEAYKSVYIHWKWASEQRDSFGLVEVIISPRKRMCESLSDSTPIHMPRGEMDTLFHQLAYLGMIPTYIGPDGLVTIGRPAPKKKQSDGLRTAIHFAIGLSAFLLAIVGVYAIIQWIAQRST